jgi:peptidoglycan hydrolase-like protein with peptidoglycan-binding domain
VRAAAAGERERVHPSRRGRVVCATHIRRHQGAIVTLKGCDYAFDLPAASALRAAGIQFAFRYVSTDPAKNLGAAERDALHSAGIGIGLVWETTGTSALGGYQAGLNEARQARQEATALGFPTTLPIYYAIDWDEAASQTPTVLDYLHGAADAEGSKDKIGVYGGLAVIEAAASAGYVFLWQTYAWSSGQWAPQAVIRQTLNGSSIGGQDVDLDEAVAGANGLWMPTGTPAPPPPAPSRPTVYDGQSGYWVEILQRSLMLDGQDPQGVDGLFGGHTLAAVKAAQGKFGIQVDGVVGNVTWGHLEARTLVVQRALVEQGYGAGGTDSVAGPTTAHEVTAFQSANHHLLVDGVVGAHTSAALHIPAP